VTKPTEQQNPGLTISQRLWNAAYDNLKNNEDTAKLVGSYVKILTAALKAETASDASASEVDDVSAKLKDPFERERYMKDLVEKGRKKLATTSKVTDGVGNVVGFIDKAKGMIDEAIGNTPQAALPWAGVCIGLQVDSILCISLPGLRIADTCLDTLESPEGNVIES
jgi:hypothetical protein